jgi:hypothetical protein
MDQFRVYQEAQSCNGSSGCEHYSSLRPLRIMLLMQAMRLLTLASSFQDGFRARGLSTTEQRPARKLKTAHPRSMIGACQTKSISLEGRGFRLPLDMKLCFMLSILSGARTSIESASGRTKVCCAPRKMLVMAKLYCCTTMQDLTSGLFGPLSMTDSQ